MMEKIFHFSPINLEKLGKLPKVYQGYITLRVLINKSSMYHGNLLSLYYLNQRPINIRLGKRLLPH